MGGSHLLLISRVGCFSAIFTTPQKHQLGDCSRLLFFRAYDRFFRGCQTWPDDENTQSLPADIHRQSFVPVHVFVPSDAPPPLMPQQEPVAVQNAEGNGACLDKFGLCGEHWVSATKHSCPRLTQNCPTTTAARVASANRHQFGDTIDTNDKDANDGLLWSGLWASSSRAWTNRLSCQ
ncbi:unnamed protein product [Vitrella brassicaformis CCMP3155]|uniref:Uncharacterized protein n=1 Tax=Vitrella brassicaformis (strain CCMP3155) TaxID=1169540 RepID=A0A0G4GPX9_VITBC|nr:unnamed protein product [Vitrella brassicaformis CCMP3155]|eukprot:CEM32435.1 unnamed protein product [Vitrella brassicaformis CCMP3155]